MSWSAPSASRSSCWARSWHRVATPAANSSYDGWTPLAPDAISTTASLVDMQPSESSRSKVTRRRRTQRLVGVGCIDVGVSRQEDQHRGQSGREHAGALGHPADRPAVALDHRRLGVRCRWSGSRSRHRCRRPQLQRATAFADPGQQRGSVVEQADQPGRADEDVEGGQVEQPRRPARPWHGCSGNPPGRCSSSRHRSSTTTTRARPSLATCSLQSTGLALHRLLVHSAATTSRGPVLTSTATSLSPVALEPGGRRRRPGSLRDGSRTRGVPALMEWRRIVVARSARQRRCALVVATRRPRRRLAQRAPGSSR